MRAILHYYGVELHHLARTSWDLPEWRVPPTNHREPVPPEGYMVSFVAFHERGLRVPQS
jgi:hypothetical protein